MTGQNFLTVSVAQYRLKQNPDYDGQTAHRTEAFIFERGQRVIGIEPAVGRLESAQTLELVFIVHFLISAG
ncbi:hypothetical protein D3C76_1304540 [compost metagenome]